MKKCVLRFLSAFFGLNLLLTLTGRAKGMDNLQLRYIKNAEMPTGGVDKREKLVHKYKLVCTSNNIEIRKQVFEVSDKIIPSDKVPHVELKEIANSNGLKKVILGVSVSVGILVSLGLWIGWSQGDYGKTMDFFRTVCEVYKAK